ncbi:hypothetical protein BU23DRAFT_34539 [Bimuria novae-zelandiae CBS 107.79]|uniref:BTB domain-containing protein n=1 Tax=Bimuria novae-zelandiae CBS 107.79 TaxID=1447943 RepID=A0A6A5UN05_9PLEO|nr:hypothetical protein BU23DRAFT_34539 [Bimuria novae-zelandiae CBS 107.79]
MSTARPWKVMKSIERSTHSSHAVSVGAEALLPHVVSVQRAGTCANKPAPSSLRPFQLTTNASTGCLHRCMRGAEASDRVLALVPCLLLQPPHPQASNAPRMKVDPHAPATPGLFSNIAPFTWGAEPAQAGSLFGTSRASAMSVPPPSVGLFGTPMTAATPSPKVTFDVLNQQANRSAGERLSHADIFDFGTKVLTVRVGSEPDHKDFTVHEELLKRSPYLSSIRHEMSSYVSLPDQKPATFNIYVQWLYSKRLYTKAAPASNQVAPTLQQPNSDEWLNLVDVYLLGFKLGDVDFQDMVMDAIMDWLRETRDSGSFITPTPIVALENVARIYYTLHNTAKDNPLRRLVSDVAALNFSDATIQKICADDGGQKLPRAFLLDLLSKLSSRLQGGRPFPEARGACHYHCHAEGKCYRKT